MSILAKRKKVQPTIVEKGEATAIDNRDVDLDYLNAELESAVVDAPAVLDREMNELLRFTTATMSSPDALLQRTKIGDRLN